MVDSRIALVIGNASYKYARSLRNTCADATAVAQALSAIGFRSHISSNADEQQKLVPYFDQQLGNMNKLLGEFNKAARTADMAIIYFSGHGIEIDFKNFLIPIEADLTDVVMVQYETVPLPSVLAAVSGASALRLVILDACRDNPFAQTMKGLDGGKSLSAGLARPETTGGALVFYAAEEGQKAREGADGALSPFANALIESLSGPNKELFAIFGRVTRRVREFTNNQQRPRFYGEPPGDTILLGPVDAKPPSLKLGTELQPKLGAPPLLPITPVPGTSGPKTARRRWPVPAILCVAVFGAFAVWLSSKPWDVPVPDPVPSQQSGRIALTPRPPMATTVWAAAPPDQAYCFQRKDSPAAPGKYLVRCFLNDDLCESFWFQDSGKKTSCSLSSGLRSAWSDPHIDQRDPPTWHEFSGREFSAPFPTF